MYNFIFIIFIIYILFIIIGIIFMIVFKESSMVPALVILTLLAGVMGFFCYEEQPHSGVITDIQIIEGTSVLKVIDDEKLNMINEKMIENNIFAIKVAKGIRISICSLNLQQCKKLPALISKIYKEVIND